MRRNRLGLFFLFLAAVILSAPLFATADPADLLSPEESLWLRSRNNTIVVYPIENAPPYSYKNSAGNPQGLAIDYLNLIAGKIGAKLQFLTPRPLSQVLGDMQSGKGDVAASVTADDSRGQFLVFTSNYLTSPAVIVARKDSGQKTGLTLNDFDGKRVVVVAGSSLEGYMRVNYPRVVVDEATDNEVALQQVVLGEDDAAAMDVASLSYFLSKQVLNSVKIVGDTGFEYEPSFGVQKNLTILQSILEKGMSQISTSDREILNAKWVSVPTSPDGGSLLGGAVQGRGIVILYALFGIGLVATAIIALLRRRREAPAEKTPKPKLSALAEEVSVLEKSNILLSEELEAIKREEKLREEIDSLKK